MIKTPIIPTEIIVHLGAPIDEARNISVPFAEYIKNVASSEIYPNWPTDSIKANILAQISFALNRIYNEYYRSQGYSFDITSTPNYDQKFVEDTQFFERISLIVDDIFNNYLVRSDQIQPLFATYCDGKNTTCSGLSQWGSVELAKKGKTPIEILRQYYGDEIKTIFNAPVAANIMTYPGFPIELGMTGNVVEIIKTQLNRISNNYPAIPKIANLTPYFTVETEKAVKIFQGIFNLTQNGIVDKATWYKIKYIYNAVKRLFEIYSEGLSIEDVEVDYPDVLKKGVSGEYMSALNYYLGVLSYFDNDIPILSLNNVYDDNTVKIVKSFQKKYGLEETGEVDVITWKKIKDTYQNLIDNLPNEYLIYVDEFYPNYFLSKGMTGDDVRRLQKFLLVICFRLKNIPGVVVNGVFDNLTEQSVKAIQKQNNFLVNGIVGPQTWYKIVQLSKKET